MSLRSFSKKLIFLCEGIFFGWVEVASVWVTLGGARGLVRGACLRRLIYFLFFGFLWFSVNTIEVSRSNSVFGRV